MQNNNSLHQYSTRLLDSLSIKHESHHFSSGAIILDIWYNSNFYVFQFEDDFIGFSKIDDNTGFDMVPDEKLYNETAFQQKLAFLFQSQRMQ